MAEYAVHLEGVAADAANPELKPEERRVAFPGPAADPLIERAAVEGYEIEGPTLAEKKAALLDQVHAAERAALERLIPPNKLRHWQFREQEIRAADHGRYPSDGTLTFADKLAEVDRTRPAEDTAFLADFQSRKDTQQQVMKAAAKLEHDIDDLTEDTVDAFKISGVFLGDAK
jgi:hypothetical protein